MVIKVRGHIENWVYEKALYIKKMAPSHRGSLAAVNFPVSSGAQSFNIPADRRQRWGCIMLKPPKLLGIRLIFVWQKRGRARTFFLPGSFLNKIFGAAEKEFDQNLLLRV